MDSYLDLLKKVMCHIEGQPGLINNDLFCDMNNCLKAVSEQWTRPLVLKVEKITEKAHIPTKATSMAAGYDLYSAYNYEIKPGQRERVKTDLRIRAPEGCYARIAPRSKLALSGIDVAAGVIDIDYTGPVDIILVNNSPATFLVEAGHRVAQLICEKIAMPEISVEVTKINHEIHK